MDLTINIDKKNNIRRHKVLGSLSKSLFIEELKNIYLNSDFNPSMHSYWDFSSTDLTNIHIEDLDEIANFIKSSWIPTKKVKSAVLTQDDLTTLLANKTIKNFNAVKFKHIRVFRDEQEAINWLLLK